MEGNQEQNAVQAAEPQPEKKPEKVVEISDVKEQPAPTTGAIGAGIATNGPTPTAIEGTRQATAVEALDRAAARPKSFVGLDAIETRLAALEARVKELETELQHHGIL